MTDYSEDILKLEKSLFDYRYISDHEFLDSVISDNFREHGKSGCIYNKDDVVEYLLSCSDDRDISITKFECSEIADGVYLAEYETCELFGAAYRISLWVKVEGSIGYRLLRHYGWKL